MARVNITPLKIPDLKDPFQGGEFVRLKNNILALMFTQMLQRFRDETDFEGNRWEPLKRNQEIRRLKKVPKNRRKKGSIKILQDKGVLRQSFVQQGAQDNETSISGNDIVLGSNVEYARVHNEGLTIQHPGTKNGFGMGIEISPHAIEMPKRQIDGFSQQDEDEISELLESFLDEGQFE